MEEKEGAKTLGGTAFGHPEKVSPNRKT